VNATVLVRVCDLVKNIGKLKIEDLIKLRNQKEQMSARRMKAQVNLRY